MFLIAVTTTEISNLFQHLTSEQIQVNHSIVTSITDNFLSKTISREDGFLIVESPLSIPELQPDFKKAILSRVDFDKRKRMLKISKPISGRPIYYHINSKGEFYCSTHISLLRKAGITIEENKKVVPEFFLYNYVIPPQTMYNQINQLVGGGIFMWNSKMENAPSNQESL